MAVLPYTKANLTRKYYWTVPRDHPDLIGKPDKKTFHRLQGWEILYMANYIHSRDLSFKFELSYFEDVIATKLPIGINSRLDVFNWLCGYFECL